LLALRGLDRVAEGRRLEVEVEVAEEVADRFRPHPAAEVDAEAVRRPEAVLELAEELLVVDDHLRLELAEELPRLLEAVDGVDRPLARVLAPRLDVEVHLAHLQRPLDERVEVLLLDLPVRAQAEVVRHLADVLAVLPGVEHVLQQAVPEVAGLLQILLVDPLDVGGVLLVHGVAEQKRIHDPVDVLRDRALLRPLRLAELLLERRDRGEDLLRRGRDLLELPRGELAVIADRRVADELADLLRVLGRDLTDELLEHAADELAGRVESREHLLLRPAREAAGPEVVVLVEALVGALLEVGAPAGEPLLEPGELLVAVDVDPLVLGLDLVLEVVQVLRTLLDVDERDDRGGEVEDLLELARGDVEQVADPARDALEEPDVRDRRRQVDVTHALAAHLLPRHLDAAAFADDPLVAHALVLAAVALPVLRGTEDALAEEPVALRLERPVVDRLRLRHLARAPAPDLLGAGEADLDCVEVVDVQGPFFAPALVASHLLSGCRAGRRLLLDGRLLLGAGAIGAALALAHDLLLALVGGSVAAAVGADAGEVDAELLRGPQELVLLLGQLDLAALVGDQVHVQAQALDLLEQDLEGLGDGRLRDVLRLDDRLVG